jgi:hypothetical protein
MDECWWLVAGGSAILMAGSAVQRFGGAMSTNDYSFTTNWRLRADIREVATVLADAPGLVRWWPSVYLEVHELEAGQPDGVGKVIELYTKGWLPYTLRWSFRVTEVRPNGFALEAWGDFVGGGNWTFTQIGPDVEIRYDWNIRADKPLLRDFSFLMKPIFSANHHWAMEMGRRSLELELARRRARSAAELASIPPPPRPTTSSPLPLLAGLLLALGILITVTRRITR